MAEPGEERVQVPRQEGGDPACRLSEVCPECGFLDDGEPAAVCPRCGADGGSR
ncbi:hypothetical protein AB0I60_21775 [Actinosynnema sp. NPDC050436]|uniref:hypothetical protein n=1 Tax=Actinosynnema sp. NPDC050436 TaxID=3155659 RepID=UPI0033E7CFBD